MNIQIFGTKKCNDTKKAERFFKERGIKYQFIDMKEKGGVSSSGRHVTNGPSRQARQSKGEFTSVAQVNGGLENMNPISTRQIYSRRNQIHVCV